MSFNNGQERQKFEDLIISFDESDFTGRDAWGDSIEDVDLVSKLKQLKDSDPELLTLLIFDGYTQAEIAALQKCSQVAVSKRISRIKKYLRKMWTANGKSDGCAARQTHG